MRVEQVGDFATAIYSRIFRPRARGTSCVFQRHRQEVVFFIKRLFYLQGVMLLARGDGRGRVEQVLVSSSIA